MTHAKILCRILTFSWPCVSWLSLLLPNICTRLLLNRISLICLAGIQLRTEEMLPAMKSFQLSKDSEQQTRTRNWTGQLEKWWRQHCSSPLIFKIFLGHIEMSFTLVVHRHQRSSSASIHVELLVGLLEPEKEKNKINYLLTILLVGNSFCPKGQGANLPV